MNDVLSYLSNIVKSNNGQLLKFINRCPICNEKLHLSENEVFAICENPNCKGRIIGKIEQFCIKMGIKGIRFNILHSLFMNKIVMKIEDLYNQNTYKKISNLEGFGEKSAYNMKMEVLYNNAEKFDYEVLGSLSIPNMDLKRFKEITKLYSIKDLYKFIDKSTDGKKLIKKICEIEGFGEKLAKNILDGLIENRKLIDFLSQNIKIKEFKTMLSTAETSYKFVITGDLSVPRDEFINKLEEHGHKVMGSISTKTDFLITNNPYSGTVKNKKAKELDIPIITEQECRDRFLK